MSRRRKNTPASADKPLASGSLRKKKWKRFLRGPDPQLLEELYVPALGEAIRYDRCCAYFSSSVLAAAARGFGRLIQRLLAAGTATPRPAVRLVVNEELSVEDVRALTETGDTSRLEHILSKRLKSPKDLLTRQRLAMLGWLTKQRYLDVRVGVMRYGEGVVHAKFGIATDEAGDSVVFSGSGNESARGLFANYERLEVSTSWGDKERYKEYATEFEDLWSDKHPDVHSVTLPEAIRQKLIKFATKEPPVNEPTTALERQKAAMLWQFIVETPYLPNGAVACDATAMVDLWPHQHRVVEEVARAWPDGRLLCDEVGLGKTIEAIFVVRRLMAGRGVRRALILVPRGLLRQWQAEFREKGAMVIPRLEGTQTLVWPDDSRRSVSGLAEALREDVLLLSRETARTEANVVTLLESTPWDLVLLDEAHAARRRKQEEAEFNSANLLLGLLRELQLRRRARGILLLSATPMQTHPWEPWDLLSVLGEGRAWLADFSGVRDYYEAISAVQQGRCSIETAQRAAALIAGDTDFPQFPGNGVPLTDVQSVSQKLAFVPLTQREKTAQWLRQGSPLMRRMHRNTRNTLRAYNRMGLLGQPPPRRDPRDFVFDYMDRAERQVYDAIGNYIENRFEVLEREKTGKGFVMTVYRRRASSSPLALQRSLERRREGLRRVVRKYVTDYLLPDDDVPEAIDSEDLPETEGSGRISSAFPEDPKTACEELAEVDRILEQLRSLGERDSKRDQFFEILRVIAEDGRPVLVFTEYWDTLDYLRESLVPCYGTGIGCYSGRGGEVWDGQEWKAVSKDFVTQVLQGGGLQVLVCTDAASEGLNLQAAGAVINYDLPWNPSRVEQRIGRIDRIGQRYPVVKIVNLFLKDSVDERVYTLLRRRCGLFEQFVGAMQPVLARARRILMGQESLNLSDLDSTVNQLQHDNLPIETYIEATAIPPESDTRPLTRCDIQDALTTLPAELGICVRTSKKDGFLELTGVGGKKVRFAHTLQLLERHSNVRPLSPLDDVLQKLWNKLRRPGERFPLVIGSHQDGSFRSSVAYWISDNRHNTIASLSQLRNRVSAWDGVYPDADMWGRALKTARNEAKKLVIRMVEESAIREDRSLQHQSEAARLRLMRELGRYLVCLGATVDELNEKLSSQMSRDIVGARRLRKCMEKLGGYPEWSTDLQRELRVFSESLGEGQRQGRLLARELDAALDDPRWAACSNVATAMKEDT